jgi:DNA-binding MarR family transcriptional regulator
MAEEEFEPTGLSPSLGFVVMTVNKKPGLAAGELASIMQLQPSSVTRLVDKLQQEGYLTRREVGKFVQVFPTAKAARLQDDLESAWRSLYHRYTALLGEESGRELTAAVYEASLKLEAD